MSNNCYKIQFKGDVSNMAINTNWYENIFNDNILFLDTDRQFTVELEKGIQELTDINKINIETVLGFSLPKTLKNLCLLGREGNFDAIDQSETDFDICVSSGGNDLVQNKLRVVSITERIEVEIIDSTDFWLVALKSLYLDQLDYGSFEYTKANLLANMTNKAAYTTGDQGIYFPFIWYGNLSKSNNITESDFRPLFHDKGLFERIFWKIGWAVNIPILETNVGRRLGSYLLRDEFNEDKSLLEQRKFRASIGTDTTLINTSNNVSGVLIFPNEIIDNGNNYNPITGIYSGGVYATFVLEITADIHISGNDSSRSYIAFQMFHEKNDGTFSECPGKVEIKAKNYDSIDEKITIECNVYLYPGERVVPKFSTGGDDFKLVRIKSKSVFYNIPISNVLQSGDVISIDNNMRHDLALDYIKGMVHLFNFKIITDWVTRTVHFLTPYDVEYYGETVGGYMLDEIIDYRLKQTCKGLSIRANEKSSKNKIYGFKGAGDAKIKEFDYEKYEEPFLKLVNNGFDISETEYSLNPYFEPTINMNVEGLDGVGGIVDAPYMLDNTNGEYSFKIGPRKVIFYGMTELFYPVRAIAGQPSSSGGYNPIQLFLFGEISYRLPYAFQKANQGTSVTGSYPNYTFHVPTWKIVYGDSADDHYQKFYKRWDREMANRPTVTIDALLCEQDYLDEDFRNRALVNQDGSDIFGRIINIKNNPCTKESTITFIPDNQLSNDCIDYEEEQLCQNFPEIIITKNALTGCFDFTIGGVNNSVITSVVFKYKYVNSDTWITGNSFCGAIDTFQVSMEVVYADGCPTLTRDAIMDACGNRPKICYSRENDCLTITECGTHVSPISSVLIEYSLGDPNINPNWKVYNSCIDLKSVIGNAVWIRLTVYYTGGCKSITLNELYPLSIATNDCPTIDINNPPEVICVTQASGNEIKFVKIGVYNGDAALDVIKYRKKGSNDEWKIYNDIPLSTALMCWEAQRVIIWCANGCPPYCSSITGCNCTCALTGGANISQTNLGTCVHTFKWAHPDNNTMNWKVVILNDQTYHVPTARGFIEQNCGGTIVNLPSKAVEWDRWRFKGHFVWIWSPNQTINTITVHQNNAGTVSGPITIPINVTYTAGNTNDFLINAITASIENYLSVNYGAVNGVDYETVIIILGTGTNRTIQLGFFAKHVVSTRWFGLKASTDLMNIAGAFVSVTRTEVVSSPIPTLSCISPCGNEFRVQFRVGSNQFLDNGLSDFDKLIAIGTVPIVPNTLTISNDSCVKWQLTLSYLCAFTPSYIWKNGSEIIGNTDTVVVFAPATLTVYFLCDNCWFESTVTI